YNEGKIFLDDIRYQSKFYFQLLSTLCQMSKQTIEEKLQSFYRTQFLSHELVHSQSFQLQFQSIFNQFQQITSESFQRSLQFIRLNFQINQFNTELNSEFRYDQTHGRINSIEIIPQKRWWSTHECSRSNPTNEYRCHCEPTYLNASCSINTVLRLNETNEIIIPGMFIGWFPYESILNSTLECFYNETCFSKISSQINSTDHFSILNSSIDENSTIEYLANQLFIQSWLNQSLFKQYFNQCHPLTCEYQYETRLNFIYIFTTFLGLVGGLNIVFRLLSPLIIKSIYKLYHYIHQCKRNTQEQLTFVSHLRIFFKFITKTLIEINLFSPIPPSNDPKIIRRNRRTTRIYFILLLTTFLILIFYITLKKETVTINVNKPTVLQYKQLFNQYSHSLQCPCTHIAIKHKMFITQFEPHYHEVCSSIYTSSKFIEQLYFNSGSLTDVIKDLYRFVAKNFGIISVLCELSKNMLNISLLNFEQTDFVTSDVISYDEFNIRIETILGEFERTISSQFTEIFQLIQIVNHGNELATINESNWKFILKYNLSYEIVRTTHVVPLLALPTQYNSSNCSCGIQSNCSHPGTFGSERIFPQLSKRNLGFHIGCENLNAILQSNLNCFYDSACVSILEILLDTEHLRELNYSSSSMSNTTIEQLFSQLFVIEWIENKSFERYFDECQPEICRYSDYVRYNFLYIIIFLIALFGGLTNGMHLIINCLSIIVYTIIDYRKKKIEIVPNSVQSDMIEVIPESSITIDQSNENSIEDQRSSKEIRRDKILLICLTLLCIIVIIASIISLFLTQSRKQEEQSLVTTPHTIVNTTTTTKRITQSTTSKICYKTFKYQDETYSTERNPVALVMGDFNQDSYVDLAIANADSNSISILLGNGNATFQKQRTYSTGNRSNPQKLAVGDLNDDGLLDL
ncbi:unnamed protein product, partial [Adineta steineri]